MILHSTREFKFNHFVGPLDRNIRPYFHIGLVSSRSSESVRRSLRPWYKTVFSYWSCFITVKWFPAGEGPPHIYW